MESGDSFTLAEITEALGEVDDSARELVLAALNRRLDERKSVIREKQLAHDRLFFVLAFERANSNQASFDDIEEWNEELDDSAGRLLLSYAVNPALGDVDVLARDCAALTYLCAYFGPGRTDIDVIDRVKKAGCNLGELADIIRDGMRKGLVTDGRTRRGRVRGS